MEAEWSLFLAWPLLGCFIALPAMVAARRRRASQEISEVAAELAGFAAALRDADRVLPMDEALQARVHRLQVADAVPLQLAQAFEQAAPETLADAAQRLSRRLRRRVAFDRKMLARTAPGLRRGAVAACVPPLLVITLAFFGVDIPASAQMTLAACEAVGCVLLWRLARVEI